MIEVTIHETSLQCM